MLKIKICLGSLTAIFTANSAFSTITLKPFATSPDKKLTLYQQTNSEYQNRDQIFYSGQDGNIHKAMDVYMPYGEPNVAWYGNLAKIYDQMGSDLSQNVFIDAKRGVYRVLNMAKFDPVHECLLASDKTGDGLVFFRLFNDNPTQPLDLEGLNVDKDWLYPIKGLVAGSDNKFLANGDFQFDYWDRNYHKKITLIKNPCQSPLLE